VPSHVKGDTGLTEFEIPSRQHRDGIFSLGSGSKSDVRLSGRSFADRISIVVLDG